MLHTDTDTNTDTTHSHGADLFMAGVAGILAGAAGITALALSDKDIRKRVGVKANELRTSLQDWSTEKLHMIDHYQHKVKSKDAFEKAEKDVENVKEDRSVKQDAMRN